MSHLHPTLPKPCILHPKPTHTHPPLHTHPHTHYLCYVIYIIKVTVFVSFEYTTLWPHTYTPPPTPYTHTCSPTTLYTLTNTLTFVKLSIYSRWLQLRLYPYASPKPYIHTLNPYTYPYTSPPHTPYPIPSQPQPGQSTFPSFPDTRITEHKYNHPDSSMIHEPNGNFS